jgi:hypothetical protein
MRRRGRRAVVHSQTDGQQLDDSVSRSIPILCGNPNRCLSLLVTGDLRDEPAPIRSRWALLSPLNEPCTEEVPKRKSWAVVRVGDYGCRVKPACGLYRRDLCEPTPSKLLLDQRVHLHWGSCRSIRRWCGRNYRPCPAFFCPC